MPQQFNLVGLLNLQLAHSSLSRLKSELARGLGDFEIKIVGLSQLGETKAAVASITKDIGTLSRALGVNAAQLADASVRFRQAGVAASGMGQALKSVAEASRTPFFRDIQSTTTGAIAAMKSFRLSASDVKGTLDSLSALSQNYSVDANQLLHSVATMGAGFRASGSDLKQLASVMAVARDASGGLDSAVESAVKHMSARLQLPAIQSQFKRLGIDLKDSRGQFIGIAEAIDVLGAKLKALPTTDPRRAGIINALGGVRQSMRLTGLFEKNDEIKRANLIANIGGISNEANASIQLETLSAKMQKVEASFGSMSRTLLSDSSLKTLVDLSVQGASALASLADSVKGLLPAIAALGAARLAFPALSGLGGKFDRYSALRAGGVAASVGLGMIPGPTGGALSGAALGATFGSYGGLPGALAGGAAGGLIGYFTSAKESERAEREKRISFFQSQSDTRLNDLASGATSLTTANVNRITADLQELEQHNRTNAVAAGGDYFENLKRERAINFGRRSAGDLTLAGRVIDDAAHQHGATAQGVYQGFASSEFGAKLTQNLINAGKAASDVETTFRRLAESSVRAATAERAQGRLVAAEAQASVSLTQLTKGLEAAGRGLTELEQKASVFSSILDGSSYGISPAKLAPDLALMGTSRFGPAFERIAPMMGSFGGQVRTDVQSISQLKRVLPGIINQLAVSGPLEGKSYSDRIVEALHGQKGIRGEHINLVESELQTMAGGKGDAGIIERLQHGADAFSSHLLQWAKPVEDGLKAFGSGLDKHFAGILSAANDYQTGLRHQIEGQKNLLQLELNARLHQARITAERAGRPSSYLDLVSTEELQHPFTKHMEALTGINGAAALNPSAIADKIGQKIKEATDLQSRLNKSVPGSVASIKLANEFSAAQGAALQLRQALVELSKVTNSAAGYQEKLNQIESNRTSRLGYAEHFLSSDSRGRLQLLRGQNLIGLAARQGHLGGMSVDNQRLVLSTLSSMGNAKLPGLGSAADLKRRLIENTVPGAKLGAREEQERQSIQGKIGEAYKTAAQAQAKLLQIDRKLLDDRFITQQKAANKEFLDGLRKVFNEQKQLTTSAEVGRIRGQIGELETPQYKMVRDLGLNQNQLSLLQAEKNQSAITDYQKFKNQSKAARAMSLQLPSAIDLEMGHGNEIVFGRNGFELKKAIADSNKNKDTIGRILSKSGINDVDTQKEVFEELRNQYNRTPQADRHTLLTQAFNTVKGRTINSNLAGMARVRRDLGERTGIAPEKLDKILNADKDLVRAINQIHDLDSIKKKIDELLTQLKKTAIEPLARGRIFGMADGGSVFRPHGTDTVPAMLTPGEYVVNARAAAAHRNLLDEINYMTDGGEALRKKHGPNIHRKYKVDASDRLSPIGHAYREMYQAHYQQLQLMEQQRRRAMGLRSRPNRGYHPSHPVGDATSLADIRRREQGMGVVGLMNSKHFATEQARQMRERERDFLRKSGAAYYKKHGYRVPDAVSLNRGGNQVVRHFAEGGSVDSSFHGTANMLAKAMEAMPRTIDMNATHTHNHSHFGLDAHADKVADAMSKLVEGRMEEAVMGVLRKALPQAGI